MTASFVSKARSNSWPCRMSNMQEIAIGAGRFDFNFLNTENYRWLMKSTTFIPMSFAICLNRKGEMSLPE